MASTQPPATKQVNLITARDPHCPTSRSCRSDDTAEGNAADQFHFTANHDTIAWIVGRLEGRGTGSGDQAGAGTFPCRLPEIGARSGTFTMQLTDTVTEVTLYASEALVFEYKGGALSDVRGSWTGTWKVRSTAEAEVSALR